MSVQFKTINENVTVEIVEKKSKFIANLFYVENIQEVGQQIEMIRKKFHDAKHHCFAYRIQEGSSVMEKASDDGEPSGTAGNPMLQLLSKKELVNVLVIVTRYFGGILLGTGGLVRAYTGVTTKAIEQAEMVLKKRGEVLKVSISYQNLAYFQYYCNKNAISIIEIEYKPELFCILEVTLEEKDKILHEIETKQLDIQKIEILREQYITKKI